MKKKMLYTYFYKWKEIWLRTETFLSCKRLHVNETPHKKIGLAKITQWKFENILYTN